MNKEKIIERLLDREEFIERRSKNNEDSQLGDLQAQNAIYYQYFEHLFDILEEVENHDLEVDEDNLIRYLQICEAGNGCTKEEAKKDWQRRQQLKSSLKKTTVNPIKKIADWAEKSVFWQRLEFWFVGILGTVIIGLLAFLLPYIHSLKPSKELVEPIKVQIIQQSTSQNLSEPITPENSTVVVFIDSL